MGRDQVHRLTADDAGGSSEDGAMTVETESKRKRVTEFDMLSAMELEELTGDAVLVTHWSEFFDMHFMKKNYKNIVFPPSSSVVFILTAVFYTLIMYNWFAILYRISFAMSLDTGSRVTFILVDLIVDCAAVGESLVSLRTGFLHQGTLVSNLKVLWRHYKHTWLALDIVSLIPIHFIGFAFNDNVYAWLRIGKLFRVARWNVYWNLWGGHARNANLVRLVKIFVIFFLIIHIFGSTYFYIVYHEGYGVNPWVADAHREDDSGISQYLFGLFWAGSFMTGSNYAEPRTEIELYFSLLMMLVGVLIFAAVIANIGGIFAQLNRIEGKYRTKMSQLDAFMRYRQLGRPLQSKIRNYYEYMWSRQQGLDDETILKELPSHLHTEVALDLTQDLIRKVPFFQGCPEGFLASLVVLLKPQIYAPGDFIIREGEIGKEMFFLSKGVVEVRAGTFRKKMDSGSIFGEIAVLFLGKRTASIVAVTYCDVYVLQKEALDNLLPYYPEQEQTIRDVAAERYARTHAKDAKAVEPKKDSEKNGEEKKKSGEGSSASPAAASPGDGEGGKGKKKRRPTIASVANMLIKTRTLLKGTRSRVAAMSASSEDLGSANLPNSVPDGKHGDGSQKDLAAGLDVPPVSISFGGRAIVEDNQVGTAMAEMSLEDLAGFKLVLNDIAAELDAAILSHALKDNTGDRAMNLSESFNSRRRIDRNSSSDRLALGHQELRTLHRSSNSNGNQSALHLAESSSRSPHDSASNSAGAAPARPPVANGTAGEPSPKPQLTPIKQGGDAKAAVSPAAAKLPPIK